MGTYKAEQEPRWVATAWDRSYRLGGRGGGACGGGRPDGLAAGGEGGEEAVEEAAAGGRGDGQRGGEDGKRGGEPREAQQGLDGGPALRLHHGHGGAVICAGGAGPPERWESLGGGLRLCEDGDGGKRIEEGGWMGKAPHATPILVAVRCDRDRFLFASRAGEGFGSFLRDSHAMTGSIALFQQRRGDSRQRC